MKVREENLLNLASVAFKSCVCDFIIYAFTVFPLETRTFEEKQIFQEEQKTICAIIKPVLGIFF